MQCSMSITIGLLATRSNVVIVARYPCYALNYPHVCEFSGFLIRSQIEQQIIDYVHGMRSEINFMLMRLGG